MLGGSAVVAFAATTDLDRARDFYGDVLGLELVEQSPFACVFRSGPGTLRVTRVDEVVAAPYTVLGWVVEDIAGTMRALADRGVACHRYGGMDQDADGVWITPGGDRVAWFGDPDGNTLSVTQYTA